MPDSTPTHIPAHFDVRDARFGVNGDSRWQVLDDSGGWVEGPVWVPAMRCLVWSDIPHDRLLRWDETTGAVGVFRAPSGYANGATLDGQGRLIHCQHGLRQVVRTEHDGSLTVLADGYDGHRLNSPNDVVVAEDGAVWFTDPDYGILGDYEGFRSEREQDGCHVYRVDPRDGRVRRMTRDLDHPNGLAFSLDGRTLYVTDTGTAQLWSFPVTADGLGERRLVATCRAGGFDGIRLDSRGRIWAAAGDGVHCYHADGSLLAVLPLPATAANLVFGGARLNRLFVTASTAVYAIGLSVTGAALRRDTEHR